MRAVCTAMRPRIDALSARHCFVPAPQGATMAAGAVRVFVPRSGGGLRLTVGGVELVSSGPVPCFWRAPTDNDEGGAESSYAEA